MAKPSGLPPLPSRIGQQNGGFSLRIKHLKNLEPVQACYPVHSISARLELKNICGADIARPAQKSPDSVIVER